jgi:flagellar protein FliL
LARQAIGISSRLHRIGGLLQAALLACCLAAPAGANEAPPSPAGPAFVTLAPIVLPVFEGDAVKRQAGVLLSLELVEGKTVADVEPQRRRLVDAFIGDLYALFEQRQDADRVIDAPLIKERLGATAARILGPGVVREVLIQQAFERTRGR